MKRLSFLIIALAFGAIGHSQVMVGLLQEEVIQKITKNPRQRYTIQHLPDGNSAIVVTYKDTAHYIKRYYIDRKSKECFLYVVEPLAERWVQDLYAYNDKSYKRVEDNHWTARTCVSEDRDGDCELTIPIDIKLVKLKGSDKRMYYYTEHKG